MMCVFTCIGQIGNQPVTWFKNEILNPHKKMKKGNLTPEQIEQFNANLRGERVKNREKFLKRIFSKMYAPTATIFEDQSQILEAFAGEITLSFERKGTVYFEMPYEMAGCVMVVTLPSKQEIRFAVSGTELGGPDFVLGNFQKEEHEEILCLLDKKEKEFFKAHFRVRYW